MTAAIERHSAALARDGWCVLGGALAPAIIACIEADLEPRFAQTPLCEGAFYGAKTRRFGRTARRSDIRRVGMFEIELAARGRKLEGQFGNVFELKAFENRRADNFFEKVHLLL